MADGPLVITVNGVDKTSLILRDDPNGPTISDILNQPKAFKFRTGSNYQPPATATIVATRGTIAMFAGTVVSVNQLYVAQNPATTNLIWEASCINYNFLFRRRRPFGVYSGSASTVIPTLVSAYSSTFTTTNVQAALATINLVLDGSKDLAEVLTEAAGLIGGYWYIDDARDVHFFLSEASATPDAINDANTAVLMDPPVGQLTDWSQVRTRVYVKGASTSTTADAAASATSIGVASGSGLATSGKLLVNGQVISYTGKSSSVSGVVPNSVWLQGSGSPNVAWQDVAYSPSLGLYCAVANGASGVMTSPDGITWTGRTPSSSSGWQCVAWAPSLGLFAACSSAGLVMTSPDGITWTARTAAGTSEDWLSICWSPDLSLFVAVGLLITSFAIMTSPDGITWTGRTQPVVAQWRKVVWAPSLSLFCAYNNSTANPIMTSPDGTTWTQRTMSTGSGYALAWSPTLSLFVAVAGANVGTSPDGITWTNHASALPAPTGNYMALCWSDIGAFVLLGNSASPNVFLSADGLAWASLGQSLTSNWRGVVWSPDQKKLVAVGSTGGSTGPTMMESTSPGSIAASLTGVTGITTLIPSGSTAFLFVQRDNSAAQTALAAIEDGGASDGIHEGWIDDGGLTTVAAANAAGDADLALFDSSVVTVKFVSTDLKLKSGKPVTINRTHPPISSITLTIQNVQVTKMFDAAPQGPRFDVTASSLKYTLQDLLAQLASQLL